MNIVYFLAPLSICLGFVFVWLFVSATQKGQYDDLDTPPQKMLLDEEEDKIHPPG